jgi:hypothetical protein
MQSRIVAWIVAIGMGMVFSSAALAQSRWLGGSPFPRRQDGKPVVVDRNPVLRTAEGKPDLSGVWAAPSTDEQRLLADRFGPNPRPRMELTAWAQEQYEYNRDPKEGFSGRPELNPVKNCVPLTAAQLITGGTSSATLEFIQSAKRLLILYQWDHNVRQIWTDGRGHAEDPGLTWLGDSVGKWDGDTLVVDTIGLRNEQWLDGAGHVHSPELRIEERYQRLDFDTMQVDLTFDDPKAFVTPYKRRIYYRLRPDWELIEDVRCYVGSEDWLKEQEIFKNTSTRGLE